VIRRRGYHDFGDRVALGVAEYKTVAAAVKRFEGSLSTDAAKHRAIKEYLGEFQNMEK